MRKGPETLANDAALAQRSRRSEDLPKKFHGIDLGIDVQAFDRDRGNARPMAPRVAAGEHDSPHYFTVEHDADLLVRRVEPGLRSLAVAPHRRGGGFQGQGFPADRHDEGAQRNRTSFLVQFN